MKPPTIMLGMASVTWLVTGCQTTATKAVADSCCDTNVSEIATISTESPETPYTSAWLAPAARPAAPKFTFEDQSGRSVRIGDLRGAPVALSFAYTRCENERKCPAVARNLGELQTALCKSGVNPRPYIALMTYDPDFDTPLILARFAEMHGIKADSKTVLLRPKVDNRLDLFRALNVSVNYRNGLVNVHGIQLILLDKQGRPVRNYHSLMWDNAAVVRDLARLAAE